MKRDELTQLIQPHESEIMAICRARKVPVGRIYYDGSLSKAQRKRGCVGRIHLMLADSEPGWRQKDAPGKRTGLKAAITEAMAARGIQVAVHIQANYSCLEMVGGMAVRHDDAGRIIGAHPVSE